MAQYRNKPFQTWIIKSVVRFWIFSLFLFNVAFLMHVLRMLAGMPACYTSMQMKSNYAIVLQTTADNAIIKRMQLTILFHCGCTLHSNWITEYVTCMCIATTRCVAHTDPHKSGRLSLLNVSLYNKMIMKNDYSSYISFGCSYNVFQCGREVLAVFHFRAMVHFKKECWTFLFGLKVFILTYGLIIMMT